MTSPAFIFDGSTGCRFIGMTIAQVKSAFMKSKRLILYFWSKRFIRKSCNKLIEKMNSSFGKLDAPELEYCSGVNTERYKWNCKFFLLVTYKVNIKPVIEVFTAIILPKIRDAEKKNYRSRIIKSSMNSSIIYGIHIIIRISTAECMLFGLSINGLPFRFMCPGP